jgi:hypothetical protein
MQLLLRKNQNVHKDMNLTKKIINAIFVQKDLSEEKENTAFQDILMIYDVY